MHLVRHARHVVQVHADAAHHEDRVREQEQAEDGRQDRHRLLHAAQVHDDQQHDDADLGLDLPRRRAGGQHAEHLVRAAGDRHRDRQHIVDEQRGAGDEADLGAEQLRRHDVAAAAERKPLDDLRIRHRDDEHRERRRQRQRHRQVGVRAERAERLVGAVRRRRQPVRAQADPGQQGDERDRVIRVRVADVAWRAEQAVAPVELGGGRFGVRRRGLGPGLSQGRVFGVSGALAGRFGGGLRRGRRDRIRRGRGRRIVGHGLLGSRSSFEARSLRRARRAITREP